MLRNFEVWYFPISFSWISSRIRGWVHVGSGKGFLLNLDLSRLWPLKYRGDDEFLNFTIFTELWTAHSVLCWIDQLH